jgi:hypothetical protein
MTNTKKGILIGCGVLVLLAGLAAVIGGGIYFFAHLSEDVEGMYIEVKAPAEVVVGEGFDLEVIVKNDRPDKKLMVSDVDLADEYLAGFTVSSVTPKVKSSMHVPIDNSRSYTFDVTIPPGGSHTFVFKMLARKAGHFSGEIDVCEGMQFVTYVAETTVTAKE